MQSGDHIAHFNWGVLVADWDDPAVAPFVAALDRVNARARRAPGFVWRYGETENEDFTDLSTDPRFAATMSVWTSAAALKDFVTAGVHGAFLARRAEWFVPRPGPTYVIWRVAAGHRPSVAEARGRLEHLARRGPSALAFDFAWLAEPA